MISSLGLKFDNSTSQAAQRPSSSQTSNGVATSVAAVPATTVRVETPTTSAVNSALSVDAPRLSVDPQNSFVSLLGGHNAARSREMHELDLLDNPSK